MKCCFTLCFQTSKYKRLQKSRNKPALKHLIHENYKQEKEVQPQEVPKDLLLAESRDEDKNQLNSSRRKKVTFSLSVQIHEKVATESLVKNEDEREVEEDTFSDSITSGSSFITYPPNHKLDNFTSSNEECENRLEGSDLMNDANGERYGDANGNGNGEDYQKGMFQEESSYESDSLFSISLDTKNQTCVADLEKEISSPFKKRVDNVELNPVEGLVQLKVIKTKSILLPSVETHLKENDVAGDASLSSWLLDVASSAGDSSDSVKSFNRVKRRQILGEIQVSNSSSLRSYGKNETPKIGTIGSYWKHTGQATSDSASSTSCSAPSITTSKGRDQVEVKCNSTQFQMRLERALELPIQL